MAHEVVRLESLRVNYDGIPVLEDVNLSVNEGEFLGIIGPNGGGKTTLLMVILGLIRPDQGKASVLGKPAGAMHDRIGYVPQYAVFDPDFPINVKEVVLAGRYRSSRIFSRYSREDREAAGRALEAVGMANHAARQIGRLSGGERQRVLIARALATDPKLLLLDEPTAGVDPATRSEFYELMNRLKEGMCIIMVTHDISAVSIYVNRLACLNRKLFYHGSTEIPAAELEIVYNCPIQLIAHGDIPHSILRKH